MQLQSDVANDLGQLTRDAAKLASENSRLRGCNVQMLAALRYVLSLLRDAIPSTVCFDWTRQAVAKVQSAIAEAERDP